MTNRHSNHPAMYFPSNDNPPVSMLYSNQGSGSGGGNNMEPRIAKLESDVGHIQTDVSDIKADLRHLLWGGLIGLCCLLGVFGVGYIRLDDKITNINESVYSYQNQVLEKLNSIQQAVILREQNEPQGSDSDG